jgi:hypothetical protein
LSKNKPDARALQRGHHEHKHRAKGKSETGSSSALPKSDGEKMEHPKSAFKVREKDCQRDEMLDENAKDEKWPIMF